MSASGPDARQDNPEQWGPIFRTFWRLDQRVGPKPVHVGHVVGLALSKMGGDVESGWDVFLASPRRRPERGPPFDRMDAQVFCGLKDLAGSVGVAPNLDDLGEEPDEALRRRAMTPQRGPFCSRLQGFDSPGTLVIDSGRGPTSCPR